MNKKAVGISIALILISTGGIWVLSRKKKRQGPSQRKEHPTKGQKLTEDKGKNGGTLVQVDWDFPFEQRLVTDAKKELYPLKFKQLDQRYGRKLAKTIHEAKGFFYDDVEEVQTVFDKRIKDKIQVSNLSKIFFDQYKKDLWQYASDIIGKETLKGLVKHKPNYTPV